MVSLRWAPWPLRTNRRLLLWLSVDERIRVQAALGSTVGIFCDSYSDVVAAANSGNIDAIVWELSRAHQQAEPLQSALGDLARSVPTLLRADLMSTSVRQITALAAVASDLRISLSAGGDDLVEDIRALLVTQATTSAEHAIIRRLLPAVAALGPEIVVGAAVLGKRRRHVGELASVIGRTERTLEWRLRTAHAPTPGTVLGWMVSLHSLWRLEISCWPVKRAAHTAGFKDSSTLSNYLKYHLGVRARSALRLGGFWYWLEHFAAQLPI
jgi:hypothetical protein